MKTEPDVFSFDDLLRAPDSTHHWDGVRNYQARNFMRDSFKVGQKVFIYHSRIAEPAVVGIAEVVGPACPDPTALDKKSPYFDPKSGQLGESRWVMVYVKARQVLRHPVTLDMMRREKGLSQMLVIKPGMRLSIQPVTDLEWKIICQLGNPRPV